MKAEVSMINYGEALKYHREVSGFPRVGLSQATGISQENISRWEANKVIPNVDFCVQLADFYGISVDDLIGHEVGKKQ